MMATALPTGIHVAFVSTPSRVQVRVLIGLGQWSRPRTDSIASATSPKHGKTETSASTHALSGAGLGNTGLEAPTSPSVTLRLRVIACLTGEGRQSSLSRT
jgi:hypothetical protein